MYIDKNIEYTIDIQTYTITCEKILLMDIYKCTIHKLHTLL